MTAIKNNPRRQIMKHKKKNSKKKNLKLPQKKTTTKNKLTPQPAKHRPCPACTRAQAECQFHAGAGCQVAFLRWGKKKKKKKWLKNRSKIEKKIGKHWQKMAKNGKKKIGKKNC
jgi:hypothetical protein